MKLSYYTSNRSKYYLKNAGGKVKKNSGKAYVIYPSGKSKKISFMRNPKGILVLKCMLHLKTIKIKKMVNFLIDSQRYLAF